MMGSTVDYFVNDPALMGGEEFLTGPFTAREVSNLIEYPMNNIYRLLREEDEWIVSTEEPYRDKRARTGPDNQYGYFPTKKASAAISHYQELLEEYSNSKDEIRLICARLKREGWVERFLRVQWQLNCDILDSLGYDRFLDVLYFIFPLRYRDRLRREEVREGLMKVHAIWKDNKVREAAISYVLKKMEADPLVGVRHWLEISCPPETKGEYSRSLEPLETPSLKCGHCGMSFGTQVEVDGHISRAHTQ